MTEITPFTFPTTGLSVRTLLVDGEPHFVAADVCGNLALTNITESLRRLDEDEFSLAEVVDSLGRRQQMYVVTEPGLYGLVLASRKPEARAFKRWIKHEVLPAIRKVGSYAVAPLTELEVARNYVAALQREQELRTAVAALAEDAHHWNTLATAGTDLDVASAAKVLSRDSAIETGRGCLFTFLAGQGWIYRTGGHWSPYQSQVDNGRLMVLPQSHYHPRTGDLVLDPPQIRITVKGLAELHKRLGGASQFQALMSEEVAA